MRSLLLLWKQNVAAQNWSFLDTVASAPMSRLDSLVLSLLGRSQNIQNFALAYHFMFVTQNNRLLGSDGYDNYQAPLNTTSGAQLYKRRMWTGGKIDFFDFENLIGEPIKCTETIESVRTLYGSTFVTVKRQLSHGETRLLQEIRSLVYSNEPFQKQPPQTYEPSSQDTVEEIGAIGADRIGEFSQLTNNKHRIHWDREYCQNEEHFPDIVVQGPFMVVLVLSWFKSLNSAVNISSFLYRNSSPIFANSRISLVSLLSDPNNISIKIINSDTNHVYFTGLLTI